VQPENDVGEVAIDEDWKIPTVYEFLNVATSFCSVGFW